jgi:hypothetical protein
MRLIVRIFFEKFFFALQFVSKKIVKSRRKPLLVQLNLPLVKGTRPGAMEFVKRFDERRRGLFLRGNISRTQQENE